MEVMQGWSHEGFHGQHYSQALARIQTELYRGDAEAAWRLVTDTWPALARPMLLLIQFVRIEASYLRARAALLNAARGRDVARFLSIARRDARRIGRFRLRWTDAVALLLSATVTYLEGRSAEAGEMLAAAVTAFERADMGSHAAAARRVPWWPATRRTRPCPGRRSGRVDGRPRDQQSGAHDTDARAGLS